MVTGSLLSRPEIRFSHYSFRLCQIYFVETHILLNHVFKKPGILNFKNSKNGHFMIFMNSSFLISKNPGILNFKNSISGHIRFPNFRNSWVSDFVEISFPISSRDVPWFFLELIQIILSNKMKKYGLPGPKTSIIHDMLSFWCLMQWNWDFMSLAWRRKIQLRHYYLNNIMQ